MDKYFAVYIMASARNEVYEEPLVAITREKQLQKWNRGWKLKLIEQKNPEWRGLFSEICQ